MSTRELIELFNHRWAPQALALLTGRGEARFVELQRKLAVGNESLRRALDTLTRLRYVRRNPGYGHPLRPEYVVTPAGRRAGDVCVRVLEAGDRELLVRKWSVPTLGALGDERRFSELRALLPVTPRALAIALQELEAGGLIRREVLATRPPSTVYRPTRAGRRVQRALG